jgi:hypothetical protein
MMLKNLEVYIEGEDEPRKLFNGSRGQVAGFAEVKGLLPELEKRRAELAKDFRRWSAVRWSLSSEECRRSDGVWALVGKGHGSHNCNIVPRQA